MPRLSKARKEEILELYYDGYKKCSCCGEIKELMYFYPVRTETNLLPFTRECVFCKSKKAKNYYQKLLLIVQNRRNRRKKE